MSEVFVHDGVEYKLPSPTGLTFYSQHALYRLAVRSEKPIWDSGVQTGTQKALDLEFGIAGPTARLEDGTEVHDIRGNYVNTLDQANEKEWSDEERLLVEKKALFTQAPDGHQLHTQPAAVKPWPAYDTTQAGKIAEVAAAAGLVAEAMAYERENAARPTVIGALKKAAEPAGPEAEELAAV